MTDATEKFKELFGEDGQDVPPILVGDGITDDTDAVQWYLSRGLHLPLGLLGNTFRLNSAVCITLGKTK